MSDNVSDLQQMNADTPVQLLTSLLAQAKRGEVTHIAFAVLKPDDNASFGYSTITEPIDNFSLVGLLDRLKLDIFMGAEGK